jgi:hypothetical protein
MPGDSALYIINPPIPVSGIMARVSPIIPIPPSQCVSDRHTITERGSSSMLAKIVAPVVENPDMLSKKASVYDGAAPLRKYGRAPTALATAHAPVTDAHTSPALILDISAPRPARYIAPETANPAASEAANARGAPSENMETMAGATIHPVIISAMKLKNFMITRILKM